MKVVHFFKASNLTACGKDVEMKAWDPRHVTCKSCQKTITWKKAIRWKGVMEKAKKAGVFTTRINQIK